MEQEATAGLRVTKDEADVMTEARSAKVHSYRLLPLTADIISVRRHVSNGPNCRHPVAAP
jgi:hypothetical protein